MTQPEIEKPMTNSKQDELAGIREKIYMAIFGNGLNIGSAVEEVLSQTVSCGGGVCPECKDKKKVFTTIYPYCENPEPEYGTCPTCHGTGKLPVKTFTVGQAVQAAIEGKICGGEK